MSGRWRKGREEEEERERERERESRKRTRGEKGRKEAKPNWAATKLAIRGLLGGSPTINNNAHQVTMLWRQSVLMGRK